MLDTRVVELLPGEKRVVARTPDGSTRTIEYDQLVLGIGGVSIRPKMEGSDLPGVFFMRWISDTLAFDAHLREKKPRRAILVGGGYIGLEMAEALTLRGVAVTIVEFLDSILTTVDRPFRDLVKEKLEEKGVKIVTDTAIRSISEERGHLVVHGDPGFTAETDTVLVAVGAAPNTELARMAGIATGIKGAIRVDSRLRTNFSDIYAGGDCAETFHHLTGKYTYIALGTIGHKHGRIIGENVCGYATEYQGTLGTQSIKLFDMVVARTGLNDKESVENGFDPLTVETEAWDHKIYYPPAYSTRIRITADRKSRRLLGGQIVGNINAEISKRIDILAGAIYQNMTVDDFNQWDLSYTPPLSSPWDPVQMAVQKWESVLAKERQEVKDDQG